MNTLKMVGLSVSLLTPSLLYLSAQASPQPGNQQCCTALQQLCKPPVEPSEKDKTEQNKTEESSALSVGTVLALMDMVPKIRTIITASSELKDGAKKMTSQEGVTLSSTLDVLLKIRTIVTASGELVGIARKVVDFNAVMQKLAGLSTCYFQKEPQVKPLIKPVMLTLPKFNYTSEEL